MVDGVIYFHAQIDLTRDSKLKMEILHAAYEALSSGHVDFIESCHTIMEGLYWEDIKEDVHQHIRRYVACLMYEEESNHLARLFQSLPLLMERWEGSSMDLLTNLTIIYGKDCVLMFIDQLKMYVHSFTMHLKHIAPQESKPLFGFHGPIGTTFSDGNDHFMEDFGKNMFCLAPIQLTPNVLHYFQDFEKLMAGIKWLDGYLSYHFWREKEV